MLERSHRGGSQVCRRLGQLIRRGRLANDSRHIRLEPQKDRESKDSAVIEQSFEIGSDATLDIRIATGKVEIRRGKDGLAVVRARGDTDNLTVEQRGSTIWISAERRSNWVARSIYVTIEVPDGLDVDAGVASADFECEPVVRRLGVNSASGDIRLTDCADLSVKTASGDVHGNDAAGRLDFVSASGDLHMGGIGGRADISTASGDVRILKASGPVNVSTMSGDVRIEQFEGDDLRAKAMSGNVDVGIPAGTTVDLKATTLSGDIRLPEPAASDPSSNGLTVSVSARLVSGDLRIRRV
ncbi:MAG: hypothetical protein DWQ40_02140 [Actinobacteria bacterium]|nr:MAG: hypothetical protein DWQ40_02140 [Actinomycetota bacterium]REK34733.1 MAG: hypothetical protein DWQ20_06610 [Actinomycetota bacterium]